MFDAYVLRRRVTMETIFDQLKILSGTAFMTQKYSPITSILFFLHR
ncbi:hypothetical protein SAMN05880573_11341 [Chryseobacterium sp. RU33C]|nr:hypothetical protein SAMN05880573_11341 [Chryseobacterium sp. RU33C]